MGRKETNANNAYSLPIKAYKKESLKKLVDEAVTG